MDGDQNYELPPITDSSSFIRQITVRGHSRTGAKILIFTDAAKYPRHISRFPYQWSNYSQIHDYKVAKVDVILNGGSPTSNAPRTSTIAVAKLLKNADSTKYHRHILRIPYQWPNLCQIRNSQRVIAPKNRYFRLFLACFQAVS